MKQFFLLIFLIKLSYVFSQAETNSTDIIEMTDKNYVRILNENEAVLVYFYSEESVKCKKMNEEIKKLNKYIQESKLDVILTKVDVAKEENVPVEMGVEEIPKLKFIRYKFKIKNDYEGKSNFQELKAFVDKLKYK
jgi:thioredoxin-like negative regulator of GroEL